MFQSELIFTLDVQKLKDLSENSFSETSLSDVLLVSEKGKQTIFTASGLESDFRSSWLTATSNGKEYVLTKYNNMNYIPLFKLSELYLIAAECADGEDAYWYLNQLRIEYRTYKRHRELHLSRVQKRIFGRRAIVFLL